MRFGPNAMRLGVVFAVVGGLPVLLALLLSEIGGDARPPRRGAISEIMIGEIAVSGGRSIDHEPIPLEQAYTLIESGQVNMVAIRARQTELGEFCYFLLDENRGGSSCQWRVVGEDVHVYLGPMRTGIPILSDDGDSIGLTTRQLKDLLERVAMYNATASTPIEVIDERGQLQ